MTFTSKTPVNMTYTEMMELVVANVKDLLAKESLPCRNIETRHRSPMACRTIRIDKDKEGVRITINEYLLDMHIVPTGLPLCPQLFSRTAPECRETALDRLLIRLLIHVTKHEYLLG